MKRLVAFALVVLLGVAYAQHNIRPGATPPIYAAAYQHEASTLVEIDEVGGFRRVCENIGTIARGISVTDSTAIIQVGGIYFVAYSLTFTGTGRYIACAGIRKNTEIMEEGQLHVLTTADLDQLSVSSSTLMELVRGDTISFVIANRTNLNDIVVQHTSLHIELLK